MCWDARTSRRWCKPCSRSTGPRADARGLSQHPQADRPAKVSRSGWTCWGIRPGRCCVRGSPFVPCVGCSVNAAGAHSGPLAAIAPEATAWEPRQGRGHQAPRPGAAACPVVAGLGRARVLCLNVEISHTEDCHETSFTPPSAAGAAARPHAGAPTQRTSPGWRASFNWRLLGGSHQFPGPAGGTCILEAAVVVAGLPYRRVQSSADCHRRLLADAVVLSAALERPAPRRAAPASHPVRHPPCGHRGRPGRGEGQRDQLIAHRPQSTSCPLC